MSRQTSEISSSSLPGNGHPGVQRCVACEKAGLPCLLSAPRNFRIKPVDSVTEQGRSSIGREIFFVYHDDHVWVDFATPVRFVTENVYDEPSTSPSTSVLVDEYTEPPGSTPTPAINHGYSREPSHSPVSIIADEFASPPTVTIGQPYHGGVVEINLGSNIELAHEHTSWRTLSFGATETPQLASPVNPLPPFQQQQHPTPTHQPSIVSPAGSAVLYEPNPLWPLRDRTEAELLRHFIDHIGPQLDVTDHLSHFTTSVPQEAVHCPLLYYAIIAVASIHRNRVFGFPDKFSQLYQAKCIHILIRFLDDPDYLLDENFLASIVVLRKGEEMSEDDRMCHLLGSSRVINSIGVVAANGGLGEAAAWLVLRQSIYVSLTSDTPLNINLACYKASSVFLGLTDHAWANKIVFILAETLVFSSKFDACLGGTASDDEWHGLLQITSDWFREKPDTFLPVYESNVREPTENQTQAAPTTEREQSLDIATTYSDSTSVDDVDNHVFPEISMLSAPHVIGLMYYHLTLIILALTDPARSVRRSGLKNLRLWHETEHKVRRDLKRCVGLALSNPHVVAANFEASHILHACGHCLSCPKERQAAVRFLQGVRVKLGWQIDHIIDHLKLP
ncbi:Fc.00g055940.m01.CDS01 [Cosmosporella sp. VM-42]